LGIYRGPGGTGDATNDASSEATLVANLVVEATAAKTDAETARTAAQLAQANAETAETNAETAQTAAEAAQLAAETAQTAAELAETNAETAQAAAETAETNAASSASAASTSASNASSSASAASTSASNAASSASAASTSATNAASSASAASTSATNAAASYDAFDDRYLGAKSSNPTVDNDGNALLTGALYYNTTVPEMRVWNGSNWVFVGASGAAGVNSFNTRYGDVTLTSTDVTDALTYTPLAPSAIGTTVQAYDAQLADIAGLTPTDNSFIVGNGTNFVAESASTARTSLGLGTAATTDATAYATAAQGTNADTAYADRLKWDGGSTGLVAATGRTSLGVTATGSDTTYAYRANNLSDLASASTARTNLGLGTIATQASSSVAITGGAIDGTPIGATTASTGKFTTVSTTGDVGIGTASPSYKLDVYDASTAVSVLRGDSTVQAVVSRASTDASGPLIQLWKSRGTQASPTIVSGASTGDITGRLIFYGYDGTSQQPTAEIRSTVDGTPGAGDMPGRLQFYTTADGSASLSERMRIHNSGGVSIGNTTDPGATNLSVTGKVSATNLQGPAFAAYGSALQSIATATYTKVAFNTVDFDTNSDYSTTNRRFTPSIAGYYQINATVQFAASATGRGIVNIYKNGSSARVIAIGLTSANQSNFPNASVIYCNGTTDYIECYMYQDSGGSLNCGSASISVAFTGYLVRAD